MEPALMNEVAIPDARKAEEENFHELFKEVLEYLKDEHSINDKVIKEAIEHLISSFRYDVDHKFSDIDLTKPDNVCGYLYRYAIHGAGLMRHKTLQALRGCQSPVLSRTLKKPALRVVSLGGGPGNDVVGFLSALHELGLRGCDLKVTVIDPVKQFAKCLRLVKLIARVGNFGSVSEMFRCNKKVDLKFVQATIPETSEDHVSHDEVKCADVVIICKVIFILDEKKKTKFISYLHHTLDESALILLVDSPYQPQLWKDFEVLYLSQEGEEYQLHQEHHWNPHCGGLFPVSSKARIAILRKKGHRGD